VALLPPPQVRVGVRDITVLPFCGEARLTDKEGGITHPDIRIAKRIKTIK
jgi:hypothetical protein